MILDKIKDIGYFIANVKNKSHVLRTRAKYGQWSDLVTRIPDALMFAIIDFVEKECFWMNVAFTEEKNKCNLELEVKKYIEQSYIKRKIFSVNVSDSVRAKHARLWMDFQNEHTPEDIKPYDELWEAYLFAKNKYFNFNEYEESGLNALIKDDRDCDFFKKEERHEVIEAYDKIRKLREDFEIEVEKHCINIVKYRQSMWT
ncbi:hypothetical protein GW796_08375 [archaeon]|nr:hypothetical protein [archaeon]